MIPLAEPELSGNEKAYLIECIETSYISSMGPFVKRFELELASTTGANAAVAVSTGTAALHLALLQAGVQRDDLVILPDLTFIASANAISYCGAIPWLLDICEQSWTLCPKKLSQALAQDTFLDNGVLRHKQSKRKISALLPVYTLGCPADMDEINKLAAQYKLPVVADAAAAIGAQYKQGPIAPLADYSCLSFNGNKTITCGGGGAIISNNSAGINHIRHLSTTARPGSDYLHDEIGFNYRMTNIQAAVGCAQLERLGSFIESKNSIRQRYDQATTQLKGLKPFPSPSWAQSSCWFSGYYFENYNAEQVKDVIRKLNDMQVGCRPFWMPIHMQPCFQNAVLGDLKVAKSIWDKILVLPCSVGLKPQEQDDIIAKLAGVLKQL